MPAKPENVCRGRRDAGNGARPATAIWVVLGLIFLTPAWAADATSGRGATSRRTALVSEIVGNWCRQTSILKVGDVLSVKDQVTYCGSPRRASDRLTIRFEPAGPGGKPDIYVYECRAPGICDETPNLAIPPFPSTSPAGSPPISLPNQTSLLAIPAIQCVVPATCDQDLSRETVTLFSLPAGMAFISPPVAADSNGNETALARLLVQVQSISVSRGAPSDAAESQERACVSTVNFIYTYGSPASGTALPAATPCSLAMPRTFAPARIYTKVPHFTHALFEREKTHNPPAPVSRTAAAPAAGLPDQTRVTVSISISETYQCSRSNAATTKVTDPAVH